MRYYNGEGYSIEKAVDLSCLECIEKDILKEFLLKNRSEEEIIALTECTREFIEQLHENVSRD